MKFVIISILIPLSTVTGFAQTFATGQSARLVIGQPEFDAESDTASQTIIGAASGLAYANNMLFVADSNMVGAAPINNRVLIYQELTSQLPVATAALAYTTLCPVCVGSANIVLGQSNFSNTLPAPCVIPPTTVTVTPTPTTVTCLSTSPQTPIATGMRGPTAVASDGTHLVVADTLNNRILIWNSIPTNNDQAPDVVVGQSNFTSAAFPGDTPTSTSLRGPQGVWIQNGKLYVADTLNNRVLIYNSIPTGNGAAADIVLGQPNMSTYVQVDISQQNITAAANNMLTPVSVTSDGTRLLVTDLGYHRVLIWNTIPTTNQQPADVEVGQPNMTTGIPDDAFTCEENGTAVTCGTTPTGTNVIKEVAAQCTVSNGIDSNSNPTYPSLCEYTLSFPRYALSDGTHLYIADGGNDRVLIYNSIPTADNAPANVVLGQTDFITDAPTDGADTMNAPLSLALDDANNLYVADTYNQRILVYTKSVQNLPYNGALNAASMEIFSLGSVTIGGTVKSGNTVSITIGVNTSTTTKTYTYTIQSSDNFGTIVQGLVALINAGKNGDPNALAFADTEADKVVLTAKVAGTLGNNVTLSTSVTGSITATASDTTLDGGASAASIAPGSLVAFVAAPDFTIADQTATADATKQLPLTLGGVEVYFNGVQSPLLFVSPTQINAQLPYNFGFSNTGTATAWVRIKRNDGSIVATNSVAISVVPANPGIFAAAGEEPRRATAVHASSYATAVISVDGTIKGGDIGSICIGDGTDELTSSTTAGTIPTGCSNGRLYNYRVQAGDSLTSVQHAFVDLINHDPQVSAAASSEFTRILLQARTEGKAGNSIPIQVVQSSGADLLLTGIGPGAPSGSFGFTLCCANTAGAPVTVNNPALPGETIIVYATGLGLPYLTPLVAQNLVSGAPWEGPPTAPAQFVSALIDNSTANVLRAELEPGMIGINQVYLQLSTGLSTDPSASLTLAQNDFVSNPVAVAVFATPLLSGISCVASTLTDDASTTCAVSLSVAVPTGATVITISASDTTLSVPSSVTIESGETSASFTVTEGTVTANETVTIFATLGSVTANTTITLEP